MKLRNSISVLAILAALGAAMSGSAAAQTYPTKQISVVVPFAAGGPSDVIARILADHMSKTLGQSMVIENVGGAGGTTGSARVAAAAPDGYTLLSGSMGSHVAAPVLYSNLKYDSTKDFEPIGLTVHAPALVVARKTMPATNMKEFVAYLKANPEKVSQGHGGVGASSHMACLLFNAQVGAKVNVVAYRGSGPALNDVVAGQLDYLCDQTMGMTGQVNSGAVKAFAVAAPQRSPALPNVPTSKEAGMPEFQLSIWSAMFAPKATPKPVVDKLNAAISNALEDAGVVKKMADLGGTVVPKAERSPKYLGDLVAKDAKRWDPILKSAAAKAGIEKVAPEKK